MQTFRIASILSTVFFGTATEWGNVQTFDKAVGLPQALEIVLEAAIT
jgi:hypothetical protein